MAGKRRAGMGRRGSLSPVASWLSAHGQRVAARPGPQVRWHEPSAAPKAGSLVVSPLWGAQLSPPSLCHLGWAAGARWALVFSMDGSCSPSWICPSSKSLSSPPDLSFEFGIFFREIISRVRKSMSESILTLHTLMCNHFDLSP